MGNLYEKLRQIVLNRKSEVTVDDRWLLNSLEKKFELRNLKNISD